MDPRIQLALERTNQNYSSHCPLSQIAQAVHLSPSRFRHLFKQEMGLTYPNYFREQRLAKAKDLLADWNLSIKQVAHRLGYSQTHNFARDFKKRFGKTPLQYRRERMERPLMKNSHF